MTFLRNKSYKVYVGVVNLLCQESHIPNGSTIIELKHHSTNSEQQPLANTTMESISPAKLF